MTNFYTSDFNHEKYSEVCKQCEQELQHLDKAKEEYEEIINLLYGNAPLNKDHLEYHLEELATYLGVKMKLPHNQITVEIDELSKVA